MKRIISIKPLLAIITIAVFAMVFNSCKKAENTSNSKDAEAVKTAALQQIKEQYGNISGGVVIPVNKQADEVFYKNTEGKMIPLYNGNAATGPNGINGPNPLCQYNCSNTTNPANLLIAYTLVSAERFYMCEGNSTNDNSTVFVKWTLSAPFAPTYLSSDIVPNTYCTIRFTPSVGAPVNYTVLPNVLNNNFTIKVLGPSPLCFSGGHTLYEITCKVNNIPNAYFQNNYTLSSALNLDVQCPLVGNVSASGFVSAPAFSQNGYLPCNRIDKVYISLPQQGSGAATVVLGNRNGFGCTIPSGFINIDNHQLEYRKVTSSTSLAWSDQSNTVYGNVPISGGNPTRLLSPFGGGYLTSMVNGTGQWLVRYRNVYNAGGCLDISGAGVNAPPGVGGGNGNWGNTALWITEVINL